MNYFTQKLVRELEAQEAERITEHWLAALRAELGQDHPLAQRDALNHTRVKELARERVQRWRIEGMEAETAALRAELAGLRKLAQRKPKQRGRAGQVREAVEELAAMNIKVTRRAVATWIGLKDATPLSKKPLQDAYKEALQKVRRKGAEGRARVKSYHET